MNGDGAGLEREIEELSRLCHGNRRKKRIEFAAWLRDAYRTAGDKRFLVIHNPGGWGNARLDELLDWEKSVVDGVGDTVGELGHSWAMVQHFRSGSSYWRHIMEIRKETIFFLTGRSHAARVLAAGLELLNRHLPGLTFLLVGASQGAAFGNAVMRELDGHGSVYSIELGTFFPHVPRRVVTERTLAIDTNGLMPDPMFKLDIWVSLKAYFRALAEWLRYLGQGKLVKFVYCIHNRGHEYYWEYEAVHGGVQRFLKAHFGTGR
jgi:hypothetical protein